MEPKPGSFCAAPGSIFAVLDLAESLTWKMIASAKAFLFREHPVVGLELLSLVCKVYLWSGGCDHPSPKPSRHVHSSPQPTSKGNFIRDKEEAFPRLGWSAKD